MKEKKWEQTLSSEDTLLIKFTQDKGKIIKFVVNYYSLINNRWRPIMRIDNCHGYPHVHKYYLHKKAFKIVLSTDPNKALPESKQQIVENFHKIKENFLLYK